MSEHELKQKQFQTEQLLDRKLDVITFLREMVDLLEFEIHELLQLQKNTALELAKVSKES